MGQRPRSLPTWTTTVSADEFRRSEGAPDLVVLDCRHVLSDPEAGPRAYAEGHIPGALHAHCDRDLASRPTKQSGRHPLPDPPRFRRTLGAWGVGPDTQVVVYDDAGGAWAARAWWLARHYGHARVALLDGGVQAYQAAGGVLTDDLPPTEARDFVGSPGHMPMIGAASLVGRVPVEAGALLDARDPPRYRGETEPIDPVAGHIPGAVNLPHKSLVAPDGRLKPQEALAAMFHDSTRGRTGEEVAVYCGSGVTSALLVLAMEHAGLGTPALYTGSWSDWIRDPSRPVATS